MKRLGPVSSRIVFPWVFWNNWKVLKYNNTPLKLFYVLQHTHSLRLFYRLDGGHFATNFEFSVADKIKRGMPPRRNRDIDYCDYCTWAHAMLVGFSILKLQLWIAPHFLGLEISCDSDPSYSDSCDSVSCRPSNVTFQRLGFKRLSAAGTDNGNRFVLFFVETVQF